MNDELRFLRQQDVFDVEKLASLGITLIGLGSIGSVTGLYLGKMGVKDLTCYDADIVDIHNVSNQAYGLPDVGLLKVDAFAALMELQTGVLPDTVANRYDGHTVTEIVISAVDSMKSRAEIWRAIREQPDVRLYIDARMGLETLVVWCIRPQIREDRVAYSQSIVADDVAHSDPCTARTVCYTPLMAASIVCSHVKRYINGEQIPRRVILDLATHTLITE